MYIYIYISVWPLGRLLTDLFCLKAGIHTCPVRSLQYGWWTYVLGERTTPRLKENSKIFCIDGNLASGKGALAQKLADRLGGWSYRMSGSEL